MFEINFATILFINDVKQKLVLAREILLQQISDSVLQNIVLQVELPNIESTNDVFHDLISCIIEQQIHYRSSKRIFAKALERSGISRLSTDNFQLFEAYTLPFLKLSARKLETLEAFIDYWSGSHPDFVRLSDEEIAKELSNIRGIGKWTIDMILLFTLNRPNVFPYDDFHLKQVMVSLYGLNAKSKLKSQMLEIASLWKDQQSLAVLYLLEWKRLQARNAKMI